MNTTQEPRGRRSWNNSREEGVREMRDSEKVTFIIFYILGILFAQLFLIK